MGNKLPGKLENLTSIINYAIEKEEEAAQFYKDLSEKIDAENLKKELLKLSAMEKGHKKKLQDLDLEKYAQFTKKSVENLDISSYLKDIEPKPDMSWQDILQLAIKREEKANKLYTDLAGFANDENAKQLFENLAEEEAAHKDFFERIWDEEVFKEN